MFEQCVNLHIFKTGAIEQYGRRANVKIHGLPEQQHDKKDDGECIVLKMAQTMKLNLNSAVFNERTDWEKQM